MLTYIVKDKKIKQLDNSLANTIEELKVKDQKIKSLEDNLIKEKKSKNILLEKDLLIEKYKKCINILNKEKNELT